MKYDNVISAVFKKRLNRFEAIVINDSAENTVHVKNTGRMRELLYEGAKVFLEVKNDPKRKTKYDLIAVYKQGLGIINIDSQAPNRVVCEWLKKQNYDVIKPEYTYKNSRFDFYMEKGKEKYLLEVKGCTLEIDGIGYFPDAPTERGVKHLNELADALNDGYCCIIAFVIQMPGITEVRANVSTHKEFADSLEKAIDKGVELLILPCDVTSDSLEIIS